MSRRLPVLILLVAALLSGCARPPGAPFGSSAPSLATSSPVGTTGGSRPATVSVPVGQSRITVGGLDLAFSASAQAPGKTPRLVPKHRWLAIAIVATNSTDATVDVALHHNELVLTDSTGARVVPYAGGRDATGVANFHGDIDLAVTTATPTPRPGPEGLRPGGVLSVTGWYEVPLHGGPFSVTWTAGSGDTVVFHTP